MYIMSFVRHHYRGGTNRGRKTGKNNDKWSHGFGSVLLVKKGFVRVASVVGLVSAFRGDDEDSTKKQNNENKNDVHGAVKEKAWKTVVQFGSWRPSSVLQPSRARALYGRRSVITKPLHSPSNNHRASWPVHCRPSVSASFVTCVCAGWLVLPFLARLLLGPIGVRCFSMLSELKECYVCPFSA